MRLSVALRIALSEHPTRSPPTKGVTNMNPVRIRKSTGEVATLAAVGASMPTGA
jgi:hypothetical protein